MASPKVRMVNVRLTPQVHEAFKIACDLRGVSMSSLMHQFVVRTIREEKELEPKAFEHVGKAGRANFQQGVPLATHSKKKMPAKLDSTHTKDKRNTGT